MQLDKSFTNSLWQQVQIDDNYAEIVQKLEDHTQPKEVQDQIAVFRIKEGTLKIHEQGQNKVFNYWITVAPNKHELKMQVLKELHCVPYSGHPGFARTLELVKQNLYWKYMIQDVCNFVVDCPVC